MLILCLGTCVGENFSSSMLHDTTSKVSFAATLFCTPPIHTFVKMQQLLLRRWESSHSPAVDRRDMGLFRLVKDDVPFNLSTSDRDLYDQTDRVSTSLANQSVLYSKSMSSADSARIASSALRKQVQMQLQDDNSRCNQ